MAFTDVKKTKRTAKILICGPTGAGKTINGLKLEGPIAAYDGGDGLKAYRDDFDFEIDPFDTIEELLAKMRQLIASPAELEKRTTYLIDDLTLAWHAALRELQRGRGGTLGMQDQAELKGPWKEFSDLVGRLGKRNKNVWVTVQAKADWDIQPGKKPVFKGMKGDITDKIFYAFDLVGYLDVVNGVRTLSILKSRYPNLFLVGDTIEHFDVTEHFKPIFHGTTKYVPDTDQAVAEEIERARKQVQDSIKTLGAASRGGLIPDNVAKRLWNGAEAADSIDELAKLLAEVRAFDPEAAAVSG